MSVLSPMLTLTVLPLVPVFLVVRQRFRKKLSEGSDSVQQDLIAWNAFLEEHIRVGRTDAACPDSPGMSWGVLSVLRLS